MTMMVVCCASFALTLVSNTQIEFMGLAKTMVDWYFILSDRSHQKVQEVRTTNKLLITVGEVLTFPFHVEVFAFQFVL